MCVCRESLLWRDGETSELEHAVCMQSEWSEAVLGRSGGECEAVLSWQVSAASAEVVAGDHEEEEEEEEARGTAMEQAKGSAEVSATDARADAGVEEDCWWCVVCVCVCAESLV